MSARLLRRGLPHSNPAKAVHRSGVICRLVELPSRDPRAHRARRHAAITLRRGVDADYEYLWRLHVRTMRGYVEHTFGPWDEGWQRQYFAQHVRPSDVDIVEIDGKRAGVLVVTRSPTEYYVNAIAIEPRWQNRGIGSKLLTSIVEEANAAGVSVGLRVMKVNPARRLYERLGFRVVDETPTHFAMRRIAGSEGD
jgi:ribosomal protein S18 acetylase RimI-like enzyme